MSLEQSDQLLQFLSDHGISVQTFTHPPVHTVEESRALRGDIAGVHTKNLFLRDNKRRFFLVVTDENAQINLKSLGPKIGAKGKLSFGSQEALLEHLGITPGAVSLFATINDRKKQVTVVIDKALLEHSTINGHPLSNERTTSITREGITAFLTATGHTPLYVSLPPSTE